MLPAFISAVLYRRPPLTHRSPRSQVYQERMYQEYTLSRAEGQVKQLEKMLSQQNQSRELDLGAMRGEISSLKKVRSEPQRSGPYGLRAG